MALSIRTLCTCDPAQREIGGHRPGCPAAETLRLALEPDGLGNLLTLMFGESTGPADRGRPRLRPVARRVRRLSRLVERLDDATQILAGAEAEELRAGTPLGALSDAIDDLADRLAGREHYTHRFGSFELPGVEFRSSEGIAVRSPANLAERPPGGTGADRPWRATVELPDTATYERLKAHVAGSWGGQVVDAHRLPPRDPLAGCLGPASCNARDGMSTDCPLHGPDRPRPAGQLDAAAARLRRGPSERSSPMPEPPPQTPPCPSCGAWRGAPCAAWCDSRSRAGFDVVELGQTVDRAEPSAEIAREVRAAAQGFAARCNVTRPQLDRMLGQGDQLAGALEPPPAPPPRPVIVRAHQRGGILDQRAFEVELYGNPLARTPPTVSGRALWSTPSGVGGHWDHHGADPEIATRDGFVRTSELQPGRRGTLGT